MDDLTEAEVDSFETAFAGWAAIATWVIAYDAWAIITKKQTLSAAFWHTQERNVGKLAVLLGWGGLTWHLVMGNKQVLPDKWHEMYLNTHPLWRGRSLLLRKRKAADIVLSGGQ
jgi:hypothetical protein